MKHETELLLTHLFILILKEKRCTDEAIMCMVLSIAICIFTIFERFADKPILFGIFVLVFGHEAQSLNNQLYVSLYIVYLYLIDQRSPCSNFIFFHFQPNICYQLIVSPSFLGTRAAQVWSSRSSPRRTLRSASPLVTFTFHLQESAFLFMGKYFHFHFLFSPFP